MKLRCWPGCVAYIVLPGDVDDGKIVNVVRPSRHDDVCPDGTLLDCDDGPGWWCKGPDLHPQWADGTLDWSTHPEVAFRDVSLRPILPPPGSVTTEEVKELFSPSPVEEEAPCTES